MELFRLNLPSDGDDSSPSEATPEVQTWAEMSHAFDHLRSRLAALRDSNPEEVVRIRRLVIKFLQDTADGIDI